MDEIEKETAGKIASVETPKTGVASRIKLELNSRKYRGMLMGIITFLTSQFVAIHNVWTIITVIAAYILGVAIEDHAAKSAAVGDTNINVGSSGLANQTVRTKRVSMSPLQGIVTEETTTTETDNV